MSRTFLAIWSTQALSILGTGLTTFGLGIWILETTGSVTAFGLSFFFAWLPGLVVAPLAGVVADRWDRNWIMAVADVGAGLRTVVLLGLLAAGSLEVWHIFVAAAVRSFFESFQMPAYSAAVTQLVERENFGRANGMKQFGNSGANILAPALGGFAFANFGIEVLLWIDIVTFLLAVLTLAAVRVPRPEASEAGARAGTSFKSQLTFGWHYVRGRPALWALTLFMALINLIVAQFLVLQSPLVLSFSDASGLGLVLSSGGIGALLGSVLMSTWGGPKRRVYGVVLYAFPLAVGLLLVGIEAWLPLIIAGTAILHFGLPITNASAGAIFQTQVEADVQGRVFSALRMIVQAPFPIAHLSAGPLADHVFSPLLVEGGALAPTLGPVLGTGPGRGIGLMLVLWAAVALAIGVWAFKRPRLLSIEDEGAEAPPSPGV